MRQCVYFSLWSDTVPAADITAAVGIEPDEVMIRGAKRAEPPVPTAHAWKIVCREPGMRVDDQIEQVLGRVHGQVPAMRSLVDQGRVSAVLQVVRYFHDEEGEEENFADYVAEDGSVLEHLGGQHQLLGWHLSRETLATLIALDADLDVDEYG